MSPSDYVFVSLDDVDTSLEGFESESAPKPAVAAVPAAVSAVPPTARLNAPPPPSASPITPASIRAPEPLLPAAAAPISSLTASSSSSSSALTARSQATLPPVTFGVTGRVEAEPETGSETGSPSAAEDSDCVSIADIRRADVGIQWYEAVAIVQALCRTIIESGDLIGPATLELQAVIVHADGAVTAPFAASRNAQSGIQCVGGILSQMLPPNDIMSLRERIVSNATADPPQYLSLEELSQALAYYERPDRPRVIQRVYERWREQSGLMPVARFIVDPIVAPPIIEPEVEPLPEPPVAVRSQSLVLVGATVVALVAVLGIGIWALKSRSATDVRVAEATNATRSAVEPPTATLPSPIAASSATGSAATEKVSSAPKAGSVGQNVSSKPATSTRQSLAARSVSRPVEQAPPATTGRSPLPAAAEPRIVRRSERPSPPRADLDAPRVAAAAGSLRAAGADSTRNGESSSTTYNATNLDVIPPVVVYPQLLTSSSTESHVDEMPAIEVLVNERGTVDSVRSTLRPRSIGESVVVTKALHAAKAWRFRPAEKDGLPVRYRLVVTFTPD